MTNFTNPANMNPPWSNEHCEAAQREGWDIFDTHGSDCGPWQLQRFDDASEVPGAPQLEDDKTAWRIVIQGTAAHHEAARQFIRTHSPKEWAALNQRELDKTSNCGSIGKHDWVVGEKCEEGFAVFVDDRQLSYRSNPESARRYALEIIDRLLVDGDYRLNDKPAGWLPPPLPSRDTEREVEIFIGASLRINAPEFFKDAGFIDWLNNGARKFTWHETGHHPEEWSDVIVMVDPGFTGEGSDSDMPAHIWNQIVEICRAKLGGSVESRDEHITVRLTNIAH